MKIKPQSLICFLPFVMLLFLNSNAFSREDKDKPNAKFSSSNSRTFIAGCASPAAQEYLEINNVRAMLLTGGDMWWDGLANPHYEIPKGSGKMSLFTGAIWIGGVDDGNQLKIAGQTYRQNGYDFWPGPLSDASLVDSSEISAKECLDWDKHFKINSQLIDQFRFAYENGEVESGAYEIPDIIKNWPAHGDPADGQANYLAPFHDYNSDGRYVPDDGDFPLISGNQAIWWVMNDKGNTHTETGGAPIGVELQIMAFAYQTNDAVNDMTFYSQRLFNRSTNKLNKTYLGQWVDADLGYYLDDYVGCDVPRGLGFCYNGDDNDESVPGTPGYGLNPPAIGVDFFKGPRADPNDGVDNDRDGEVDEPNELIIMSNFLYYNNDASPVNGNPNGANHFYNYLRNRWGNGLPCTYDLKAGTSPVGSGTPATNFMFPGTSDPTGKWTGSPAAWDEVIAGNSPGDRRFLQSAGPFTLTPGQVMDLTIGVVWARASSGGRLASVLKMKEADNLAQLLFESGFKQVEGPDAPDVEITEYDKEIVMTLTPHFISKMGVNNEDYFDTKKILIAATGEIKRVDYYFQGYTIYQLSNPSVTDMSDQSKARTSPELQCDVKDGIDNLINFTTDPLLGEIRKIVTDFGFVPTNAGVKHTFKITKDLFNSGAALKNNQEYYYKVVSYAAGISYESGKLETWIPDQYLAGSANLGDPKKLGLAYTAIPHSRDIFGDVIHSKYNDVLKVRAINISGNGGNDVDLSDETVQKIIQKGYVDTIDYYKNSPVSVNIFNPGNVKSGDIRIELTDGISFSSKKIPQIIQFAQVGDQIESKTDSAMGTVVAVYLQKQEIIGIDTFTTGWISYKMKNDKFFKLNDSVSISRAGSVIRTAKLTSAVERTKYWVMNDKKLGKSIEVSKKETNSLYHQVIKDYGFTVQFNSQVNPTSTSGYRSASVKYADSTKNFWLTGISVLNNAWFDTSIAPTYNNIFGGSVAPFKLVKFDTPFDNPGFDKPASDSSKWEELSSVNIVFTNDKNLWTRSVVVFSNPQGGTSNRLNKRTKPSVDKNGNTDTSGTSGMGWFPGYAINVDKGERLNIIFAEDTTYASPDPKLKNKFIGRDLLWNPDSLNSHHFVYILNSRYDSCKNYYNLLSETNSGKLRNNKRSIFGGDGMWVINPRRANNEKLFSNNLVAKIRVDRKYQPTYNKADRIPSYEFSLDEFATVKDQQDVKTKALDLIRVVPNPYLAYSAYEKRALDNAVRVTNLPVSKTTISIYTISGTLIRQIVLDADRIKETGLTFWEWDLKNQYNIPVASGAYVIHIDAGEIGEKVVKFFAVTRPMDFYVAPKE
ncbi:MAG: hypothetical protein A3H98_01770 [Bacteroidetes bacterium RIFCSPLOWO2_02_FULL_36_8]|nr:MAG: hypothetical protein A3H98_01770 [Bacteroidetes bacterium RIFCSPLOWO2_02_FULL_36_8]OFY69933.1 MAG: hypothetical protein A3G23_05610 [Bacteroidetes bacterium RIFCSPLOWO2_12_FULL_37_12]